jgi:hypothetical protein
MGIETCLWNGLRYFRLYPGMTGFASISIPAAPERDPGSRIPEQATAF